MTMTYPFPVLGDEFKGKRVLVTGGTKGMGEAMVRRFTLSGASVATTARSPLPEGQAVALFVQTDIATAAGVREVISRIQQEWGPPDGNNRRGTRCVFVGPSSGAFLLHVCLAQIRASQTKKTRSCDRVFQQPRFV